MPPPDHPKIFHIIHVDRLPSVLRTEGLLSDARMVDLTGTGTTIGMDEIKQRRLDELKLSSHPELHVGQCVPFYFCPRSVMLYLIWQRNHPKLAYKGGEGPIVHLMADLQETVAWASSSGRRWAFTLSNAGAYYFEDRSSLQYLGDVNWSAVGANKWAGPGISSSVKDGKQAEFLIEEFFPWALVERIGVRSLEVAQLVGDAMRGQAHRPPVEIRKDWYYGG